SVVSRVRGASSAMPAYVSLTVPMFAETPFYLGAAHRPFSPKGPDMDNLRLRKEMTPEQFADRRALLSAFDRIHRDLDQGDLAGMDAFQARALEMISTNQARDAFDLSKEPDRVRARYGLPPNHALYRDYNQVLELFLTARRLVEAGVPIVTFRAFE